MKSKMKVMLLVIVIVFVAGSCFVTSQFVKTNTKLIIWNYTIACDAFDKANADLIAGEKDERVVLQELSNTAFEPIWQIGTLTKPLIMSEKWYSSELRNYLMYFDDASNLTDQEIKAFVNEVDAIAAELNKINWTNVQHFEGSRKEVFEVVEHIDEILTD